MSSGDALDPEEMYEATTLDEMVEWLERCELTVRSSKVQVFSRWEMVFLEDTRKILDDNVAAGRKKPLAGRSLSTLKKLWDRT